MLNDAQRRSQLLSDSGAVTAGYNNGFFVKSQDNNFALRPSLYFQTRYVANYRQDTKHGESTIDDGFEIRRLRLALAGNAVSPDLTYFFEWESGTSSYGNALTGTPGNISLLDAFATYRLNKNWLIKGGQFTDPVNRETLNGVPSGLSGLDYLSSNKAEKIGRVQFQLLI